MGSRSRTRRDSRGGRYANMKTHAILTPITVANTAADDQMSTDARMPSSSLMTSGSCNPINRNANDSRVSTTDCHSAKSCKRVA